MQTPHIYSRAYTLSPYLTIKCCGKAIEIYKKTFIAIEKQRLLMNNSGIAHAKLKMEKSLLMMAEENPNWQTKSPKIFEGIPVPFGLNVADADKSLKKAISSHNN